MDAFVVFDYVQVLAFENCKVKESQVKKDCRLQLLICHAAICTTVTFAKYRSLPWENNNRSKFKVVK